MRSCVRLMTSSMDPSAITVEDLPLLYRIAARIDEYAEKTGGNPDKPGLVDRFFAGCLGYGAIAVFTYVMWYIAFEMLRLDVRSLSIHIYTHPHLCCRRLLI